MKDDVLARRDGLFGKLGRVGVDQSSLARQTVAVAQGKRGEFHARRGRPFRRGDRDRHDGPRQSGARQSVENKFGTGVGGGENDVAAGRPEQDARRRRKSANQWGKAGAAPETSRA